MRIAIASDLHLDFDRTTPALAQRQLSNGKVDTAAIRWWMALHDREALVTHPRLGPDLQKAIGADLLVLGGDIDSGRSAVEYAAEAAAYCQCPVIFVPGNHEYYGYDIDRELPEMRALAACSNGRVNLLDRDRLDMAIEGRRVAVLGATLWTDYALNGSKTKQIQTAMRNAGFGLNDHTMIRLRGNRFQPFHARQLHDLARRWLAVEIPRARAEADLVVVVTHHAVIGQEASAEEYRGGDLNPAFASDMRTEIEEWGPDLWISGHTHHSFDVQVGRTRCVSAQRGYVGSEAGAETFVPLIVDV